MDDLDPSASGGAAPVLAPPDEASRPVHLATNDEPPRRRRRWLLPVLLVPILLLAVLVIASTIDSSAGTVPRNVTLAGHDIGGLSEDELAGRIGDVAMGFTATPVEIAAGDHTYTTTAGDLGLTVDEEATSQHALDIDDGSLVTRPFAWLRSLVSSRTAPVRFQVNAEQAASTATELQGKDLVVPTEPSVALKDGRFVVVPGKDGLGLDTAALARLLPPAAEAASTEGRSQIGIDLDPTAIPPVASDDAARQSASAAEALVGDDVVVHTSGGDRTISADTLHTWVRLTSNPDGTASVAFDPAKVGPSLRRAFADVAGHPVDASFTLEGGQVKIVPDKPGKVCCGPDAGPKILAALQAGDRELDLALIDGLADLTAKKAAEWGIKQPVGGNHAWRSGAATTAGPGFTTYHDPTGARITNIHRIADIIRGAVIAPGASFSINDYVGQRTTAKGFVEAGAIANGEHVSEVGGGISQFATTTFNAAYFAGLQIDDYQAHSEWFDRYPRGREATMGYPAPDLSFTNNTPYGIMIWTSYTQSSLTVTLYSTPYGTADQTAISEGTSGKCTTVTTTRTTTYPDGHTKQDKFHARYRPEGSTTC